MVDEWTVTDAPEARQLIWKNFKIRFFARQTRRYLVYALVAVTILFYMIPIGVISALTTLSNLLSKRLASLPSPAGLARVSGSAPEVPAVSIQVRGDSFGEPCNKGCIWKIFLLLHTECLYWSYPWWNLFSTFKDLQKNPNSIVSLLANSLPGNATFFLTFVALKFFVGYGLELSRIVPLIIFHLKRKYLCKTEAELKEAWFPGDFGYGTRVPGDMLIFTIVLCYSVIAPIILPFGVAYFGLGWLVLRNQAIKVFVPSYESNGRMWPHMHNRILIGSEIYRFGQTRSRPSWLNRLIRRYKVWVASPSDLIRSRVWSNEVDVAPVVASASNFRPISMFKGCSEIGASKELQYRLAWHLTNCYQEDAGTPLPPCDAKNSMMKCRQKLNADEFARFAAYFLDVNKMVQLFKKETERLLNELQKIAHYADGNLENIEERSEYLMQNSKDILELSCLCAQSKGIAVAQVDLQEGQVKMKAKLEEGVEMVHEAYANLG
ncbi:hypothetical protein QQ045_028624 [Rhodiola kirilowii]